jgi:hypothetical protein
MLLAVAVALVGCSSGPGPTAAPSSPAPEHGSPPQLLSATLQDSVVPREDGRVAWTTTWSACFGARADTDVAALQTQVVTAEGTSPEVTDLPDGCIDLDVATGVDDPAAGMPSREIQLSDAQALAYRVRARLDDGTVTPWTEPVRVGTTTPAG